jgi:isoleucyl-tRNA synthetase
MAAVQSVISLGLSARQAAKLNVKQPLPEIIVSAGSEEETRAIERFNDLILDELNIKEVRLHDAATGKLLTAAVRLNKKTAAAKLGAKLKEAEAALAAMDTNSIPAKLSDGKFELAGVPLDSTDIIIEFSAKQGWCGIAEKNTQVAIDTTITEELKHEGLSRIVIRQVQDARKKAELDLLDKIELYLSTDWPELTRAIAKHQKEIAVAVQAVKWSDTPLTGDGVHTVAVKVEGQSLTISLRKV